MQNEAIPRPKELFDSIVPTLKGLPEILTPNTINVLSELWRRGDGLVLYTQGPLRIQFEKIARSGLAEYFHALCVVRSKSIDSLRRLQYDFNLDSGEFIVVGNSLRSDIEPALEVGLKAVHFNNPNSWHIQNLSTLEKDQYRQIDNLTELLEINI